MKRFWFICFSGLLAFSSGAHAASPEIRLLTEQFSPLNEVHNGKTRGVAVEILKAVYAHMGRPDPSGDIVAMPWSRAYAEATSQPNVLLFSIIRTPEREGLFHWVGPIMAANVALVGKDSLPADVDWASLPKAYRYGVLQDDFSEQQLIAKGLPRTSMLFWASPQSGARMLMRGRIDVWVYERSSAFAALAQLGENLSDYQVVHEFKCGDYYFAFSRGTDEGFMWAFQEAFEAVERSGERVSIVRKLVKSKATVSAARP
ncbi:MULTISPECIES: substrate-binding periplasmic protein [Kordiimonas]|jgi:polar amino acid transport system substrate-binding protein|uniref:substrate-binding periplasmic protein n=1 Tax=Kordiimonas TaxID=288021 RepID=UPI00257BC631|nr:ABC transporter substrate-binding protein [Kordiimonas sp. UBA4487]